MVLYLRETGDGSTTAGLPYHGVGESGLGNLVIHRLLHPLRTGVAVDASNVYGSSASRTMALRTLDGSGRLETSIGDLLPLNEAGLPNAPSDAPRFFLAGDIRANEQVGLTAMHTVFVREHNFWADSIRRAEPRLSGDEVFEYARAMVAAEIQAITYREFLPLLLGRRALPPYRGYDPAVNAGIANEFATAFAMRVLPQPGGP